MKTQILSLGGGNFSGKMKDYLLSISKSSPKICLLPTASGNDKGLIKNFYNIYPHNSTHLSITPKTSKKRIREKLLESDIILVTGGNTIYLLDAWKAVGADKILKEAFNSGIVLAGVSAGMNCWFEEFATDSLYKNYIAPFKEGLGFIKGSSCPHYNYPPYRKAFNYFIDNKMLKEGFGAEGGVALHFVNGKLENIVSSQYRAKGFSKTISKEQTLMTRFLGQSKYRSFK
jgi:dipeptidase E